MPVKQGKSIQSGEESFYKNATESTLIQMKLEEPSARRETLRKSLASKENSFCMGTSVSKSYQLETPKTLQEHGSAFTPVNLH